MSAATRSWKSPHAYISDREAECSCCKRTGVHVDTTCGEILGPSDAVVARVSADVRRLMTYNGEDLLCDECAESPA